MKYLILLLLFLLIFWYYKRKKSLKKNTGTFTMRACENCGVYFPEDQGFKDIYPSTTIYFCSKECFEANMAKEREKGC
ncbi:MAG: hypothetical protein N2327_05275 [Caldimicrobium sp.]|nr:hypothetical protein [Caldimicrobium sp.]MCX7873822.1 hypothetical protein [Caldimicrobium sp.]MDW8094308.1 hypothetical protein [Caldimicrobium sp.]